MKRKVDKRFQTSDDIQSLDDFDITTLNKVKEEEKETISTRDIPPNNTSTMTNKLNRTQNLTMRKNIDGTQNVNTNTFQKSQETKKEALSNQGQKATIKPKPRTVNAKYNQGQKRTIIELKGVGLAYDREIILSDVNLKINKGDFVYLVGESGAGKSSIIKMLYREIKATKGEIIIDTQNIVKLSNSKLPKLRRKIGVIFQDYKLLPDKTIYKNVAFSLEVTGYPRKKIKPMVMEALKKVGISNQAYKYPDELSGGQQQRAAIARAIVDEPLILVADEPTGNLDPENALSIMELLEQINNEGTTIVMATHDVGIVNNFPKRVILLGQQRVLKESQGEYIYE